MIEDQGLLWKFILNAIILTVRPRAEGPRLRQDLEPRAKRIAAQDHHPLAGGKASPRARRGRRPHRGRLGDALRQSVARLAHRGAGQGRLRAHPAGAALSAIRGGDHRDGVRRGVRRADEAARPAGAARGAAVLRRSGLYRGAGRLDRGRAASAAVCTRRDPRVVPRHPEVLRRRRRSLSARNARRPRGCCARGLALDDEPLHADLPVALRHGRMAAALHRQDRGGAGASAA